MNKTKQISISQYCKEFKAHIKVTDRTIRKAAQDNNISVLPQVIAAEKIGRNYVLTVLC